MQPPLHLGGGYTCFRCGSNRYLINDCPQGKQQQPNPRPSNQPNRGRQQKVQVRQGRINFTTLANLPEGAPVMTGTFLIQNQPTVILFDFGATHSFISTRFAAKCGLNFYHTKGSYMITTPGGKIASNQITRRVPIKLGSKYILTDLILLGLEGIDIILGTNWMTQHKAVLVIFERTIEINSPT